MPSPLQRSPVSSLAQVVPCQGHSPQTSPPSNGDAAIGRSDARGQPMDVRDKKLQTVVKFSSLRIPPNPSWCILHTLMGSTASNVRSEPGIPLPSLAEKPSIGNCCHSLVHVHLKRGRQRRNGNSDRIKAISGRGSRPRGTRELRDEIARIPRNNKQDEVIRPKLF